MSSHVSPRNLSEEPIVVGEGHATTPVKLTPTFFEDLARDFNDFDNHVLVSCFEFDADWPTSEMHPAGDEIVVLVSGAATMVLFTDDGEELVELAKLGDYIIVPKGTWHTARVSTPTKAFFVTPGAGTQTRDTA